MHVGVNYPWFDYGWDFGLAPPDWRRERITPRWYDHIENHLEDLHDIGISIIRWFVLADGLVYGTGLNAPRIDVASTRWVFDPPSMPVEVLDHFEELLRRITQFNAVHVRPLQLLPVLIDFHFCEAGIPILTPAGADPGAIALDADWVKQGRNDCVVDDEKRQTFLATTLDRFLEVSGRYVDAVYAWDIINEPDWITSGWHPDRRNDHPVPLTMMNAFLRDAIERVQSAGFRATVGFGLVETLLTSDVHADLNQFHHYPGGTRILPPQLFEPNTAAILGEFSTVPNDIWPELDLRHQRVLNRLRTARDRGYPVAIPWSYLAKDRHSAWSEAVQQDVLTFTQHG